jgi:hypothetical protein
MSFRPTPDYASEADAEAAWNDAWAMVERGEAQAAIPVYERLYANGLANAAAALGSAWRRSGDIARAEHWGRLAVYEHDDEDAKPELAGILIARVVADALPADGAEAAEAMRLIEEIRAKHPYAGTLAGLFCRLMHDRGEAWRGEPGRDGVSRDWLDEARRHYQAVSDAGLVVGTMELGRVLWRQKRYGAALAVKLRAMVEALRIGNKPDDPRLFGFFELYDPFKR